MAKLREKQERGEMSCGARTVRYAPLAARTLELPPEHLPPTMSDRQSCRKKGGHLRYRICADQPYLDRTGSPMAPEVDTGPFRNRPTTVLAQVAERGVH